MPPHSPTACNTQIPTATTTTTFRMDLILEAIGMYRFIRYNATPTITSAMTRFIKGIFCFSCQARGNPLSNRAVLAGDAAKLSIPLKRLTTARHLTKCGHRLEINAMLRATAILGFQMFVEHC